MKFISIFKFQIETIAPLNTDNMGEMLSRMSRDIMNSKHFKGNIKMTTVSIDPQEANRMEP